MAQNSYEDMRKKDKKVLGNEDNAKARISVLMNSPKKPKKKKKKLKNPSTQVRNSMAQAAGTAAKIQPQIIPETDEEDPSGIKKYGSFVALGANWF